MDQELSELTKEIASFIEKTDEASTNETKFNELALKLFECQFRLIEPFQKLCERRGRTPGTVKQWRDIPAVPADAFKEFFLFAGKPEEVVKTFQSSGTTKPGTFSQAHFSNTGLDLMKLAVEVNAHQMLFPDNLQTRIFVIAPSPENAPHMIMAHGMSRILENFGAKGSRFCIGPNGLDIANLVKELQECNEQKVPVTLMGSSFGFVHLFEELEKMELQLTLPKGSRLMDAGGYKGKNREIARETFVNWACSKLGLQPDHVVNLLGMTETASQIYDNVLSQKFLNQQDSRKKAPPHWVRTWAVNPAQQHDGDLERIEAKNTPGLLRHLDLANVERPLVIQTDDVGILLDSGFEILKRTKGAQLRGCSLTMEEFAARQA